ncbi:MAG: type II toxin-antitoxin system HicB family antitoxin [bacterium]|nr:type II toxin-antitoxin system HicB family antitoxin [bacterium]
MEILFKLDIEKLPEGVYLGTSDDVPGLVAQGRTMEETIDIAKDVARKLYDSYIEDSQIPPFKVVQTEKIKVDVAIPIGA